MTSNSSFLWFLVAAMALGLAACQGSSDAMQTENSGAEVGVMVGLQRTACFGRCPVYELSVLSNGQASLRVERFCDEAFGRSLSEGMHHAQVDIGIWRKLIVDEAQSMGFDTLASRYDDPKVMDLPANIMTVDGKTVWNRYGGPNLTPLYTRIERLVGSTDWVASPQTAR